MEVISTLLGLVSPGQLHKSREHILNFCNKSRRLIFQKHSNVITPCHWRKKSAEPSLALFLIDCAIATSCALSKHTSYLRLHSTDGCGSMIKETRVDSLCSPPSALVRCVSAKPSGPTSYTSHIFFLPILAKIIDKFCIKNMISYQYLMVLYDSGYHHIKMEYEANWILIPN